MQNLAIFGLGSFLPEIVLTNEELSKSVDTSDEWITARTGIRRRHILAKGETNTDMGLAASRSALREANIDPSELTHVLYATCTPDTISPSASCILCNKLGITGKFVLDVNAACCGFLFGLVAARGLLAAQPEAKILLVAAEALSTRTNWKDRSTCVLFGDGGGAVVLGAERDGGLGLLVDVETASDGSLGPLLHFGDMLCPGEPYAEGHPVGTEFFVQMNGREVFKHAVRSMAAISKQVLERNGLTIDDIDLVVPHQANLRIIEAVGSRLGANPNRVFVNVDSVGNTSAASIPIALDEARRKGVLKPGMRVLACTFGGGLTWSAALLRF